MVRVDTSPRRGVVLVAVVLLHAGLVLVVAVALRNPGGSAPAEPVSTLILLQPPPTPSPVPPSPYPARTPFAAAPSTAITLPPLTAPVTTGPVDWDAEANTAVAAAAGAARARAFGRNPASEAARPGASPGVAVHHAGEQYRDADGTAIVFVSDRCFVVSSPMLPGTPDVIARAVPTRTVCQGDPGWSRADLFKDLPAYLRYHRQAAARP